LLLAVGIVGLRDFGLADFTAVIDDLFLDQGMWSDGGLNFSLPRTHRITVSSGVVYRKVYSVQILVSSRAAV